MSNNSIHTQFLQQAITLAQDNAKQGDRPFGFSSQAIYEQLGIRLTPQPLPLIKLATGITAAQLYAIKH